MRVTLKIFLLIIISSYCLSCELDRFPYDKLVSEDLTMGSIESRTLGIYGKMKEEYYYKTLHHVGEYAGDNVALKGTTSDNLIYVHRYERLTNNYYTARVWSFTFQMVGNINKLLEEMDTFSPSNEEERQLHAHLRGENYMLRAWLYFACNNVFARQYLDSNGAANNLGLPIKTVSDIDYFPGRSSVADVYEQVIRDAKLGAKLMERSATQQINNNTKGSIEVAWSLLSRVNLYKGDWEQAELYADSVINSGRYKLLEGTAYQKYPQHVPETNTETIWCIRMVKDTDYKDYYMNNYSVGSLYCIRDNDGWGEMYPSESYLQLLRQNPEDLRFGFIEEQYAEEGGLWMLYVNDNATANTWTYVNKDVVQEGSEYRIVEDAGLYTSPYVQKETVNGKTQYYVTTTGTGGRRFDVIVEPKLSILGLLPRRYILKCSFQEQQGQLWSPVLFRFAETYLNRAEARYHRNNFAGAVADLNVIRDRAGIPQKNVADATSNSEILNWILDDRRLELAWEAHRKYDIFRNGLTLDRRYPGFHLSTADPVYTLDATDNRVVEYIPQQEIDTYPGSGELIQNN